MFTKKIIYCISHRGLEEALAKTFQSLEDYCFVSDLEASNHSNYTFTVTGQGSLEALAAINSNTSYNITLDALNVMCSRGLIPPGEYLVEVSW